MTNIIEQLRQDAIDSFFDDLEVNGYDLESDEAQTAIHEAADSHVPSHNSTLLEFAAASYRNTPANFFLLASVESSSLGSEITAADVLSRAIYEFLCDEIREVLQARIEEENDDEGESE